MKAERRHQLQENSLIRSVRNFPEFWKAYGSKILLGLILIVLAIVLIRMWINKRTEARRQMSEDLTAARASLENLRSANEFPMFQPGMREMPQDMKPEQVAEQRRRTWSRVDAAVNNVLQNSSDPAQLAAAKLLRADLNYHFGLLASIGKTSDANKARGIDNPPEEYFDRASQNYSDVISQASAVPAREVNAARLGLGAVDENREKFAEARALYESVERESSDEVTKQQATTRLHALALIRPDQYVSAQTLSELPSPFEINPHTRGATKPATGPASAPTTPSTGPATAPAIAPSTRPASTAPTSTAPATAP